MAEPAATPLVSGAIQVEGVAAALRCRGWGYPCLIVGSSTYYRRTFTPPLKEALCSACMDHRGFTSAATTGPHERYTLDMIVDDVEEVRRAFGWERVVVYGHSVHGLMPLEYAR